MAFAAEVKKDKAHIPVVKTTTMSDADMDKVTAGAGGPNNDVFLPDQSHGFGKNDTGNFNSFDGRASNHICCK
jgi:hypothetical protein